MELLKLLFERTKGFWLSLTTGGLLVGLSFLGPLAPAVRGIATFIGSIFSAIAEIITSMAKSVEGRVGLAVGAAFLGGVYLRFHYIEEGRQLEHRPVYAAGVKDGFAQGYARAKAEKCAVSSRPRPRRSTAPARRVETW